MKLYDKQLNSLEALKREKLRLTVRKSFSKSSDLMPVRELKKGGSPGMLGAVLGALNAKGGASQIMAIAGPVLGMIRKRREKSKHAAIAAAHDSGPRKPSFIKRAAVEVFGGYIRWKAIEMGYNALKLVLKSRKKRQEQKMRMRMH